jgi:ribonuclease HII
VDALTSRPLLYERKIRSLLSLELRVELVVENHADKNYPIVGAASILAKVERDRRVRLLEKKYGTLGSGYPSDPRTIGFLRNYFRVHGDFPTVVRKRWKTIQRLKEEKLLRKKS